MPTLSEARLEGRAAIVTGAAQGIGARYAAALAAAGAAVACCDVLDAEPVAARIRDAGGRAIALRVDVTSPESTRAMAAATLEAFGRIDVLVNNAGLFANLAMKPFDQIDAAEWDRVMAVNLRGPFLAIQAVAPHMRARRTADTPHAIVGKVVNVASGSALRGNPDRAHYVASKAGLIGLTRSLARALGPDGICVNALLPGITASDTALAAYPGAHFERSVANRALKRVGEPSDLIGALRFLCGPESDFITGQSLVVDGGNHML